MLEKLRKMRFELYTRLVFSLAHVSIVILISFNASMHPYMEIYFHSRTNAECFITVVMWLLYDVDLVHLHADLGPLCITYSIHVHLMVSISFSCSVCHCSSDLTSVCNVFLVLLLYSYYSYLEPTVCRGGNSSWTLYRYIFRVIDCFIRVVLLVLVLHAYTTKWELSFIHLTLQHAPFLEMMWSMQAFQQKCSGFIPQRYTKVVPCSSSWTLWVFVRVIDCFNRVSWSCIQF